MSHPSLRATLALGAVALLALPVAPAGAQPVSKDQPPVARPMPPRGARPRPTVPGEARPVALTTASIDPAQPIKEFGTMWTFDAPPLAYWKARYGFTPDQAWLDHVRLSTMRLPGCSSSIVSPDGLLMTNHHCGREWVTEVAPKDTNYHATGWAARDRADEKKVPGAYVDQLEEIVDVTARIGGAITAATPTEQARQRTEAIQAVQAECQAGVPTAQRTCQVVTFYQGGKYALYRFKRYGDIRLVMVPEEQIAFYGGDADNFTYPRYDLDVTFFRVYENGQPLRTQHFLKWDPTGPSENELVFVVGNPGSTGRLLTVAQMEYLRDVQYPAQLAQLARMTDVARRQMATAEEGRRRELENQIFGLANSTKAIGGYLSGLRDSSIMARKRAFEADFRRRVQADPALRARYGRAWDEIAAAQRQLGAVAARRRYLAGAGSGSMLWQYALAVVQLPTEAAKPDSARLPQFRGPALERIRGQLAAPMPIDKANERMALAAWLAAAQRELPANDPFLATVLAGRTPEAAAAALVDGTTLADPAARQALLAGGPPAAARSTDPMVVAVRALDPGYRAVMGDALRQEALVANNAERIGQALFATYGTTLPPDATFTLRITDGVVKGYPMNGTVAPWKTTFYGLYDRAASFDGKGDFRLPARWADPARRARLDMTTPYDFVTTNDIIGGNSGSPMIDRNAQVVGLIFDGNIESLPNRFIFTDEVARTVAVTSQALGQALRVMYDAGWVADELEGRTTSATATPAR